jgi:hypothetical protein
VGPPRHFDEIREALYPDTADREDLSYKRVMRLVRLIRGEPVAASEKSRTAVT